MQLLVRGETHHLRRFVATAEEVEGALRNVTPEKVRVHSVEVGGRVYPVKQALAVAFGLKRADCFPHVACRAFRQLGFRVAATSRRPTRRGTRARLREALPDRTPEIGPVEDVFLELPPIHLAWSRWEHWEDIAEHGIAIIDLPRGKPGVYEARLKDPDERLTIGRASDLRTRILHAFIRGTASHPSGDKIREQEDLRQVLVRLAVTDRSAAVEEGLHRHHIARLGRLPKHTICTQTAHPRSPPRLRQPSATRRRSVRSPSIARRFSFPPPMPLKILLDTQMSL